MAFILFLFALTANIPRITAAIPSMVISIVTTPAIESASRRNNTVFIAYLAVLVVSGLVVAIFTFLTWDAGNKVQDAVQADANARIGEANSKAAAADERSKTLEASNLALRGEVASLETKAAEQQTRAAKAELALLELQQRLAHRRINRAEHDDMVAALHSFRGSVVHLTELGDSEAKQFADDLVGVLTEAGWSVEVSFAGAVSPPRYGLSCSVDEASPSGYALAAVLRKLPTADVKQLTHGSQFVANIFVGLKPPA